MGVFFSLDEQVLEAVSTDYNTVAVVASRERINMDVEGATFATWHPRYLMTGYSWDALAAGCLLRQEGPPASVLLLGLAGGTVARQLRALVPEAAITGVDIDAGVLDLARRHMQLDELGIEVVVADADRFLAETDRRFDAIVEDLFLSGPGDVMRAHCPEGERLARIQARLAPGGVVVANLITDPDGPHFALRPRVRRAFAAAFATVRVVRPPMGLNEILVGGERSRTATALRGFAERLTEPYDQRLLRGVRVELLRRRRCRRYPARGLRP
jgi:2-polyprenyl-3-methyl-5-hydroxy-6-metoxy-1,4-benzoquinol methylase